MATGDRLGQLTGWRWSDIDLTTGRYSIKRAAKIVDGEVVYGDTKRHRSRRADILPAFGLAVLERHREAQFEQLTRLLDGNEIEARRRQKDGFVFTRLDGSAWNPYELSRRWSRLVRATESLSVLSTSTGLPFIRFHDLRHTHATKSRESGTPLEVVSQSLGHANIGITSKIYGRVNDQAMADKAERLDGLLGPIFQKVASSKR